ncbi:uncharacterized protein LOC143427436 [Xylocopa sonorina]|uniref:uncharacterized protein LOC143427436 n=1 Tax=Xylocopa sonorina TaxID=1818115 RepID=UPI00403B32D0
MWYEILPPAMVIAVCSALPFYVSPYINKFFLGNPQVRNWKTPLEHIGYGRDYEQGGGKFWKFNGLDVIPDK